MLKSIAAALRHARAGIAIVGATYVVSATAGGLVVHGGAAFALRQRDAIVSRALRADPASLAEARGEHATAAAIDFSRNLGLAAIPDTVGGLTLVMPVGTATYRGWVGGIVSVDRHHRSRLTDLRRAT